MHDVLERAYKLTVMSLEQMQINSLRPYAWDEFEGLTQEVFQMSSKKYFEVTKTYTYLLAWSCLPIPDYLSPFLYRQLCRSTYAENMIHFPPAPGPTLFPPQKHPTLTLVCLISTYLPTQALLP